MNAKSPIDQGMVTNHYIKETPNGKHFIKEYPENSKHSLIGKIERKIFPKNVLRHHMQKNVKGSELKEQELLTWKLWKSEGIPVLNLVDSDSNKIVWEYLEAPSLRMFLENESNTEKTFQDFMSTYTRIRELAKEKKDTNYLHNDPWFKNYLVSKNQVIPIDPGIKLNKDMSLEEIDTNLNRITLCSIASLNIPSETKAHYIEDFRSTFSKKEASEIVNFNFQPGNLSRAYWKIKGNLEHAIKGQEKKNIYQPIDQFQRSIDGYIAEIFRS